MRSDYPQWTLVHLCRRQAERHGDRPFLDFEQGDALSYRDIDSGVSRAMAPSAIDVETVIQCENSVPFSRAARC